MAATHSFVSFEALWAPPSPNEVGGTFEIRGFDPYRPECLVKQLKRVRASTNAVIMVGVDNDDVVSEIGRLKKKRNQEL